MRLACLTLSYNDEDLIGAVIKNWQGIVEKHLVLHSDKPWHGKEEKPDRTEEIVKSFPHTEFIRLAWKNEAEQRNWGLARLYDFDYVLIVDSDEFYTRKDQKKILEKISDRSRFYDNYDCYRIANVRTYFKTTDYILDPPDTHKPVVAVNPKKILFKEARIPNTDYQILIDATLHHLSYCRSDEKIKSKLEHFEHYNQIKKDWFEKVWLKWTPEMEDIRAYGHEKSKAKYSPLPEEIKNLIKGR